MCRLAGPIRAGASSSTAEQRTLNPQVPGSNPGGRTTKVLVAALDAPRHTLLDGRHMLLGPDQRRDPEMAMVEAKIAKALKEHCGYKAIEAIPGVGPILGAVFAVEIGDVTRFPTPAHLVSWTGLTPRHRESDTEVRRQKITKEGPKLVRWAAIEAVSRTNGPSQSGRTGATSLSVAP